MDSELFHCPFTNCAFNKKKSFKKKALLDQHLLNCHTEKRYRCSNCRKSYAIEWQLKYHLKTCGREWTCATCNKVYKERLSLITHCNRNDHILPEDAKLKNFKKSQRNLIIMPMYLNGRLAISSKFRPILPKNEFNTFNHTTNRLAVNNDMNNFKNNSHSLPYTKATINTPVDEKNLNGNLNSNFNDKLNNSNHNNNHNLLNLTFENLNLDNVNLIDNFCQTDNLCQCSQIIQTNKKDKLTNTFGVQCPEINDDSSTTTNLKRKTRFNLVERQETQTQTYDWCFVERPLLKNQSTSTDINSNDLIDSKRKTVASETSINNLNKNYCFINHPFHNQNGNHQTTDHQTINHQTTIHQNTDHQIEFTSQSTYENESNSQDPLLSTISVQTDLDYDINDLVSQNVDDHHFNDSIQNYLEFNDIQTQTYLEFNDNFTQTDFSLDNIFDN